MMACTKFALLLALVWMLSAAAATGRELSPGSDEVRSTLTDGALFGDGGSLGQCWNALLQLRSCSDELAVFVLNGEVKLGPDCCEAIQVITRRCWPTLLASVGLTADEASLLRGYCDAEGEGGDPSPPPPPESAPTASQPLD